MNHIFINFLLLLFICYQSNDCQAQMIDYKLIKYLNLTSTDFKYCKEAKAQIIMPDVIHAGMIEDKNIAFWINRDATMTLWDLEHNSCEYSQKLTDDVLYAVATDDDNLVYANSKEICLRRIEKDSVLMYFSKPDSLQVSSLKINKKYNILLGFDAKQLYFWSMETGNLIHIFDAKKHIKDALLLNVDVAILLYDNGFDLLKIENARIKPIHESITDTRQLLDIAPKKQFAIITQHNVIMYDYALNKLKKHDFEDAIISAAYNEKLGVISVFTNQSELFYINADGSKDKVTVMHQKSKNLHQSYLKNATTVYIHNTGNNHLDSLHFQGYPTAILAYDTQTFAMVLRDYQLEYWKKENATWQTKYKLQDKDYSFDTRVEFGHDIKFMDFSADAKRILLADFGFYSYWDVLNNRINGIMSSGEQSSPCRYSLDEHFVFGIHYFQNSTSGYGYDINQMSKQPINYLYDNLRNKEHKIVIHGLGKKANFCISPSHQYQAIYDENGRLMVIDVFNAFMIYDNNLGFEIITAYFDVDNNLTLVSKKGVFSFSLATKMYYSTDDDFVKASLKNAIQAAYNEKDLLLLASLDSLLLFDMVTKKQIVNYQIPNNKKLLSSQLIPNSKTILWALAEKEPYDNFQRLEHNTRSSEHHTTTWFLQSSDEKFAILIDDDANVSIFSK